MHKSSMLKMEYFKNHYLNPTTELKILDVGSFDKTGNYNYGQILNEKKWTYHGLDLRKGNNVDILVENPYDWKEIEENTYDVVVSGQSLEHAEFFWLTIEQIKKVLIPGGLCCIIVPSSGPVHKNPYDCYRFNENGVRSLMKYIDFDILESGTNEDEISHPWYDSYVIGRKPMESNMPDLKNRVDTLENKLDYILKKLEIEN